MREIKRYNKFTEREETILLDDLVANWIEKKGKEILFNNRGYAMMYCRGKVRPLHCIVWYIYHRQWSVQFVSSVHHLNHQKLDNRECNLSFEDWDAHMIKGGHPMYGGPKPKELRIA